VTPQGVRRPCRVEIGFLIAHFPGGNARKGKGRRSVNTVNIVSRRRKMNEKLSRMALT
jgi:hypothetical protein